MILSIVYFMICNFWECSSVYSFNIFIQQRSLNIMNLFTIYWLVITYISISLYNHFQLISYCILLSINQLLLMFNNIKKVSLYRQYLWALPFLGFLLSTLSDSATYKTLNHLNMKHFIHIKRYLALYKLNTF